MTRQSLDDIPEELPPRAHGNGKLPSSKPSVHLPRDGGMVSQNWSWEHNEYAKRFRIRPRANPNSNASAYREHFPEMVFRLRLLGATNRMIAEACGVIEATVLEWLKPELNHPEFKDAMEMGGDMADAEVAHSVFHCAVGYTHDDVEIKVINGAVVRVPVVKHYKPDVVAGTYWLNNRQKDTWKNRNSTALTDGEGKPLIPPQLVINPVRAVKPKVETVKPPPTAVEQPAAEPVQTAPVTDAA